MGVVVVADITNRESVNSVVEWKEWIDNLNKYDEQIEIERGGEPQDRDGLDELFP